MKVCKKCGVAKKNDRFYKEARVKDGLSARCKACCKADAKEVFRANPEPYRKRAREVPPEKSRAQRLRKKYGITIDDYNRMLEQQGGTCAICPAVVSGHNMTDDLLVDHCHSTNKVRGLLCADCNLMLGCINDNVELLEKAVLYLQKQYA